MLNKQKNNFELSKIKEKDFSRAISSRHIIIIVTGYVISLFLFGLAAKHGLDNLNMLNQRLSEIVYENNEKAVQMTRMRNAIRERILLLYSAIEIDDPFEIDEVWQKFTAQARIYIISRDRLYDTNLTEAQRDRLAIQRNILRSAQPVLDRVFETLRQGNQEMARLMLHDARGINNTVTEELQSMVDQQQALSRKAVNDGVKQMRESRDKIYTYISIAVIVAVVILLIIVMVIVRQARAGRLLLWQLDKVNVGLEKSVAQRTAELEQQSRRNELIVNAAMDGFFIANFEGKLLDCNDVYCDMIGYSQDELTKLSIEDIQVSENPVCAGFV